VAAPPGRLRLASPARASRRLIDLDPIERGWYQHLEYAPLINARAHQLGDRRTILNDALAAQYRALPRGRRPPPARAPTTWLAAAHYLFALDRIDDALAALARVDARPRAAEPAAGDYLAPTLPAAAATSPPRAPCRRPPWITAGRPLAHRFAALAAMLDEAQGCGPTGATDPDSREQRMATLAARQPALAVSRRRRRGRLQHHNLAACQLRFYRMDIELLFSRQPFLRATWSASLDRARRVEAVDPRRPGRPASPLPAELRGATAS
jgi:hypothetical protein